MWLHASVSPQCALKIPPPILRPVDSHSHSSFCSSVPDNFLLPVLHMYIDCQTIIETDDVGSAQARQAHGLVAPLDSPCPEC